MPGAAQPDPPAAGDTADPRDAGPDGPRDLEPAPVHADTHGDAPTQDDASSDDHATTDDHVTTVDDRSAERSDERAHPVTTPSPRR